MRFFGMAGYCFVAMVASMSMRIAEPAFSARAPDLSKWKDLASFRPSESVQRSVHNRGAEWAVHRIEDAKGARINLDYFPVRVKKLPTHNGAPMTAEGLLKHVRLHMNDFVDTSICTFKPFNDDDAKRWTGDSPTGSVLLLTISVLGCRPGTTAEVCVSDLACVVVSQYSPKNWRFSTVRAGSGWTAVSVGSPGTPVNAGAHPVSGNREFGFVAGGPGGAAYTFYTIGADRATRPMDEFWGLSFQNANDAGFREGEKLWKSFQQKLVEFINANQGQAEVAEPTSDRHDWLTISADKKVFDVSGQPAWVTR